MSLPNERRGGCEGLSSSLHFGKVGDETIFIIRAKLRTITFTADA
jgi:hypothetical protein